MRRRKISFATSTVDAIDNRQPSDAAYFLFGVTFFTYANLSNLGNYLIYRNLLRITTLTHTTNVTKWTPSIYIINATKTDDTRKVTTRNGLPHILINNENRPKIDARMSYLLFSTARITDAFPAIFRTRSQYTESRSLRVSRHPESRRETNGSLSTTADVTMPTSLMPRFISGRLKCTKIESSVQSPSDKETRK